MSLTRQIGGRTQPAFSGGCRQPAELGRICGVQARGTIRQKPSHVRSNVKEALSKFLCVLFKYEHKDCFINGIVKLTNSILCYPQEEALSASLREG